MLGEFLLLGLPVRYLSHVFLRRVVGKGTAPKKHAKTFRRVATLHEEGWQFS